MPTGGRSCWRAAASRRRCARWFEAQGFVEVETAALQVSPGNEAHLHAFATELIGPDGDARAALPAHLAGIRLQEAAGGRRDADLRPSPASSATASAAPLHHPEFTMLEWYRADEPYEALMDDCAALLALAAEAAGADALTLPRPRRRSLRRAGAADAWPRPSTRFAGIDLLATRRRPSATDRDALAAAAARAGIRVADDDTWADVFSRVLVEKIEPHLGHRPRRRSSCEYPVAEAALARPKPGDPRVAERFELYACGVELANAFGELTDPAEQRRRFEAEMAEKAARLRRALSDRRGFPGRAGASCRRPAASRSASTGW